MSKFRLFLLFFIIPAFNGYLEDDMNLKDSSQVGVRAVFIDCEMNEKQLSYGSEISRFQREELFKHDALRDCKKKLALTVKMTSESGQPLGDEYIPIEHVFDGPNKKRVRLLNPYILRLRREAPFEAYKLRELDTFSGLLTTSKEKLYKMLPKINKNRYRRNIKHTDEGDWFEYQETRDKQKGGSVNITNWKRKQRSDFESEVQKIAENKAMCIKNHQQLYPNGIKIKYNPHRIDEDALDNKLVPSIYNTKSDDQYSYEYNMFNDPVVINDNFNFNEINQNDKYLAKGTTNAKTNSDITLITNSESNNISENLHSEDFLHDLDGTEKNFILYELGAPDVWFRARLQLLEKLSTPEGKSVWKDITKQDSVQVSSSYPEWSNQDLNIRYRCAEWIPREDFNLPSTGICLLLPQHGKIRDDIFGDFIVVPCKDIEPIEQRHDSRGRRYGNSTTINEESDGKKHRRRILVRIFRAMFGRKENNYRIVNEGSVKYLRIPFTQPHHAQIDLEAKADENQLVYIGSSGRLTTAVVAQSTRSPRAVITVQATNTGLAAARFRPKIRECGPEIMSSVNGDEMGTPATSILIPPMHSRTFRLEMPIKMPDDVIHCLVVLLNDGDESVAVRDVRIKQGDRCFCVWHCQCVCLSEDPKLLCQEMAAHQQVAAGLAPRDRPRPVRAACYPDVATVNLLVIVLGVILILLALGLLKACLGLCLRCVGIWGIDQLLQTPRRLDCYYESSLRCRTVVFDEDGWPVHPDTKERTVRLISKPMEFVLNVIFFVVVPCLVLRKSLKKIISRCQNKDMKVVNGDTKFSAAKSYSPQNLQGMDVKEVRGRLRRKRHLNRWMSPQAAELSTDIWQNGLGLKEFCHPACMRSLIREEQCRGRVYKLRASNADSEQDDTEYVLLQMQNSRESLAKHHQKLDSRS